MHSAWLSYRFHLFTLQLAAANTRAIAAEQRNLDCSFGYALATVGAGTGLPLHTCTHLVATEQRRN